MYVCGRGLGVKLQNTHPTKVWNIHYFYRRKSQLIYTVDNAMVSRDSMSKAIEDIQGCSNLNYSEKRTSSRRYLDCSGQRATK